MNVLASLAAMPFPQAVGLALIHFLWQGALIGALLSGALLLLRNRSATARYLTCLGALALLLLAPAVTAYVLLGQLDLGRGGALGASLPAAGVHAPNWITQLLPWITGGWIVGAMALQARLDRKSVV